MHLSADQFATIIAGFTDPTASEPEQRRAERMPQQCLVPIILGHNTPEERQVLVTVCDLSPRGVGLVSSKALPRGEQFVLKLNGPGGTPTVMLCAVAHCRPQGRKTFAIGAEFTCILSDFQSPAPAQEDELARIRDSLLG